MPRLKTFMSPVFYRLPAESAGGKNVELHQVKVNGRPLCWLDEMLEGGIELPSDLWEQNYKGPPFLLLLAGPPGTGKTIFALELCYNLARFPQPHSKLPFRSLYISTETTGSRIIENSMSFGWKPDFFNDWKQTRSLRFDACNVFGIDQFSSTEAAANPSVLFDTITQCYSSWAPRPKFATWMLDENKEKCAPDIVVLDSLNVLWPQAPSSHKVQVTLNQPGQPVLLSEVASHLDLLETFYRVRDGISGGAAAQPPRIVLVVLDSFFGQQPGNPWEFLGDGAMRFDSSVGPESYFSRSFQIVKLKTQTHALGNNHVYKIIPGAWEPTSKSESLNSAVSEPNASEPATDSKLLQTSVVGTSAVARTSSTPFLESGGTFVFPSIHWHLSRSIREDPLPEFTRNDRYSTGLEGLDAILGAGTTKGRPGLPSMHTTALVGRRGGMKSHLAYNIMLSHALATPSIHEPSKNVLLISLQDDLDAAKNTLVRLIEQQDIGGHRLRAEDALNELLRDDILEIVYNWPGCVTPNELFHRIFVSLARERSPGASSASSSRTLADGSDHGRTAEIVVVTGLEHLEFKFPLCASEKMFVPALISLFRCFKVCSVVVSSGERDGSAFDVRPLSDLILDFSDAQDEDFRRIGAELSAWQTSKVVASRVPAGQIGGLWGLLMRHKDGAMQFQANEPSA